MAIVRETRRGARGQSNDLGCAGCGVRVTRGVACESPIFGVPKAVETPVKCNSRAEDEKTAWKMFARNPYC